MNKVQTAILELGATGNLNDIVDNYIANGLEDDRLLDPITNLLSRFELVKLLILSYKEEIITKPKNDTYKNTLLFTELESTACSIAKKLEDGRYEISGRIFEDANTVVVLSNTSLYFCSNATIYGSTTASTVVFMLVTAIIKFS